MGIYPTYEHYNTLLSTHSKARGAASPAWRGCKTAHLHLISDGLKVSYLTSRIMGQRRRTPVVGRVMRRTHESQQSSSAKADFLLEQGIPICLPIIDVA
eukprot:scaffold1044_cov120-Isochrysis_galbana.AAC.33